MENQDSVNAIQEILRSERKIFDIGRVRTQLIERIGKVPAEGLLHYLSTTNRIEKVSHEGIDPYYYFDDGLFM